MVFCEVCGQPAQSFHVLMLMHAWLCPRHERELEAQVYETPEWRDRIRTGGDFSLASDNMKTIMKPMTMKEAGVLRGLFEDYENAKMALVERMRGILADMVDRWPL